MEFLLNYGWAIILVLVVIGALSYFGVLDPKAIFPEKCIFKAGFDCKDYAVNRWDDGTGGAVKLKLINNFGETATISAISFASKSIDITCSDPSNTALQPGKAQFVTFICSGTFPDEEKVKFTISGDYYTRDPAFTKEIYGELTAKINTVPKPAASFYLTLSPGSPQYTFPNTPVQFIIKVENRGEEADSYTVKYGGLIMPGSIKEEPIETIQTGIVNPGDVWEHPVELGGFAELGRHPHYVEAASNTDPASSRQVTMIIRVEETPTYNFDINIYKKLGYVMAGQSAEYEIDIWNRNFAGTFLLEHTAVQGSPQVTFSENNFEILSNERKKVKMTVKPSAADVITEIKVKGTLSGPAGEPVGKWVDGIKTITACAGYELSNILDEMHFFDSRIEFEGGKAVTKKDPSYSDEIMPTYYEVKVNGVIFKLLDIEDDKLKIGETGLVSSVEIVPVFEVDGQVIRCTAQKVQKSPITNLDPDDLEIKKIWKVWDDGGPNFWRAAVTNEDSYSGESSLLVSHYENRFGWGEIPYQTPLPNFEDVDYLVYAIKNKDWQINHGLEIGPKKPASYNCGAYYAGSFPCSTYLPGRDGLYIQPITAKVWKLNKVDLSSLKGNGNCADLGKPSGPITAIQLSVSVGDDGDSIPNEIFRGYYDTIYLYTIK